MKLEQQVVSLELAQKLKELGVKQEGLFYHFVDTHDLAEVSGIAYSFKDMFAIEVDTVPRKKYSAFTVAELGEMLKDKKLPHYENGKWIWGAFGEATRKDWYIIEGTEADARAKMLIYLIENKLI